MPRIYLRAITPRKAKVLDAKILRKELEKSGLEKTKKEAVRLANRTVRTWKNKPKFKGKFRVTIDEIAVDIIPSGSAKAVKIYGYVTSGTKAHVIKPKKKFGTLAFKSKFKSKTRHRRLFSTKGYRGGKTAFAKVVHHPGTKAREFEKEIRKQLRDKHYRNIDNAFRRAARRSRA